jgi:hypothetical protein
VQKRNPDAAEIYDQGAHSGEKESHAHAHQHRTWAWLSLNYANVIWKGHVTTAVDGLNRPLRRITISTAGIAKMIKSWPTTT